MQGYPDTTEEASDLPEVFKINKAGLPVKVFLLRQKLYRKSKQEPNIVRGPAKDCGRQIPRKPDAGNLPVRFDEGGLNLRHHGSSAAARLSPLLYRNLRSFLLSVLNCIPRAEILGWIPLKPHFPLPHDLTAYPNFLL